MTRNAWLPDKTRKQIASLAKAWGLPPKRHLSQAIVIMTEMVYLTDREPKYASTAEEYFAGCAFTEKMHLPFPTRVLSERPKIIEYIIPEVERESVLHMFFPFEDIPSLDDQRFDLHEGKDFTVKDFMIVRENKMNLLVSPYYMSSGGTVLDWQ